MIVLKKLCVFYTVFTLCSSSLLYFCLSRIHDAAVTGTGLQMYSHSITPPRNNELVAMM